MEGISQWLRKRLDSFFDNYFINIKNMLKESQFNYFCTYLLAHEAESRGIKVSKPFTKGIFAKRSLIILKYKKHAEVIVGQRTSHISVNAYWIQKDKYVTKYFLHQAGIKTAPGEAFKISDRP